jgi:hydroxymethylglutaryl-CoA lyase
LKACKTKNLIPTEIQKLKELIIKEMELTSFVTPKRVPQMQEDILNHCLEDTMNIVLVPNRKGSERFIRINIL